MTTKPQELKHIMGDTEMTNDWKPEKNISAPLSDTYIQSAETLPICSFVDDKYYDVDTTKLTSVKDIAALFDLMNMRVSETNKNFDKIKHLLIYPNPPEAA